MKLSQMLENAEVKNAYADVEISFVTDKAEKCVENCAFVCIEGKSFDGHNAVDIAEKNGATVFVVQRDTGKENQIFTEDTRKTYALMCSNFFGNPSRKLKIIGITGTNGKTTVAHTVYELLTLFGKKAGLIGTEENIIDGKSEESFFTTPDAFEFNRLLKKMADSSTEYCVSEVSSQALHQKRTYPAEFETAVFTNISDEHLDYHGSFENYFASKRSLFGFCKNAVINIDDSHAEDIIKETKAKIITFSTKNDTADITARNIKYGDGFVDYSAVMFSTIGKVRSAGTGEFSVSNSLAATAAMLSLGFDFYDIIQKMPLVKPVRGRGEKLETNTPYRVIVDYAHTPDALYNILYALSREKKGRLITLFGCGGNRDKTKRAKMGNIAASFSDIVVLTNDNPRNENEDDIINDILKDTGSSECRIYVEKDRFSAIRLALMKASKNDTVLIAGKGNEAYQIIGDEKIPFNDREKVAEILGI